MSEQGISHIIKRPPTFIIWGSWESCIVNKRHYHDGKKRRRKILSFVDEATWFTRFYPIFPFVSIFLNSFYFHWNNNHFESLFLFSLSKKYKPPQWPLYLWWTPLIFYHCNSFPRFEHIFTQLGHSGFHLLVLNEKWWLSQAPRAM